MNTRDFDYIEARLLAPCDHAIGAHERLRKVGEAKLAAELMAAMQEFTDRCRVIRQKAHDRWKEDRA